MQFKQTCNRFFGAAEADLRRRQFGIYVELPECFEKGAGGGVFGDGLQSFDGGFEVTVGAEGLGLVETGALLVG